MKFDHQNHSTTSSVQPSELSAPVGPGLTDIAERLPDETLLFRDDHLPEECLVNEQETAAAIAAPSVLNGPEATYAVLNALQLNGVRNNQNMPAVVLSAGGGRFAVQIAERWKDATVVFADEEKMNAAVSKPVGSNNAIDKYLSEPHRDSAILRNVEMKVGINYCWDCLDQTSLKADSFSCAIIEQGKTRSWRTL